MDGGTYLNYGDQTKDDQKFSTVGGQVGRYFQNRANSARIQWPKYAAVSASGFDSTGYMQNFHLNQSCALRAAMCCFSGTLSPTQTISKNANVCAHNIADSKNSSHVRRGWSRYNIQGAGAYCVGFAWSSDPTSVSAMYKGNALFAASLSQTLQYGYSKNIAGAPMCACVEQMPTVTNAACVSVDSATESALTLIYQGLNTSTNGGNPLTAKLTTSVTYGNCGGKTLPLQHAALGATPAEQTALSNKIVGSCAAPTQSFMNERFFVPGNKASPVDLSKWTQIVGQGSLYYPMIGESALKQLLQLRPDGRYPMIYRYCSTCWYTSHRNIYYLRNSTSPFPAEFLELLMNNWVNTSNVLNVDFQLFSSYSDALSNLNPWQFCDYNNPNYGFPLDCGPTGSTGGMWNSYVPGYTWGAYHHQFYVEKYP